MICTFNIPPWWNTWPNCIYSVADMLVKDMLGFALHSVHLLITLTEYGCSVNCKTNVFFILGQDFVSPTRE